MKQILLIFISGFICLSALQGQKVASVPMGMNYQAVARTAEGYPLTRADIELRISFTSAVEQATIYYAEYHQLQTDELGLFQLIIGEGQSSDANLLDVPWAKEDIWMDVELRKKGEEAFQLVSSSQMLSVPYALYAQKTLEVAPAESTVLRNQSTRWLTSGNNLTNANVHFLGNRDSVDIVFKTANQERMRVTASGQVNIVSPVTGEDNNRNNYPLVVEGSNQGIWIKINDSRSSANNFLTFRDKDGTQGRVEGQTNGDFSSSSDFIRTTGLFTANAVILGLKIGTGVAKAAGFAASLFGVGGSAPEALQIAAWIADGVAISIAYGNWLAEKLIKLGVSFESGAGDFAEYIQRAPNTDVMQPGQVVGIKGGMVSLNTADADHVLVISTAPAILGNAPNNADRSGYEKVAFLGQVIVRVVGPVEIGDYILPSGNNDGYAVAVHPNQLLPHEYKNIVGVSWEAAPNQPLNFVNVAIGLNQNDLAKKTAQLESQVDNITNYLEGKEPLSRAPQSNVTAPELKIPNVAANKPLISMEEYDRLLEENEALIRYHVEKTFSTLESQGYEIKDHPEVQKYFQDPVGYLKDLRRTPSFEAQWKAMETIVQEEFETKG